MKYDKAIEYLQSKGWEKRSENVWRRKNWKSEISYTKDVFVWEEWDQSTKTWHGSWQEVSHSKSFDPDDYFYANFHKAYLTQLKIDVLEAA